MKQLDKAVSRIADAIVNLVEGSDGPVTLAELDRDIPDFATKERPAWNGSINTGDGDQLIWAGMTEAGQLALSKVLYEQRVAVQFVSLLPYLLERCVLNEENWLPIVLLPAKAANLNTPKWLLRVSPGCQEYCRRHAAAENKFVRLLTPSSIRFTADQFAL